MDLVRGQRAPCPPSTSVQSPGPLALVPGAVHGGLISEGAQKSSKEERSCPKTCSRLHWAADATGGRPQFMLRFRCMSDCVRAVSKVCVIHLLKEQTFWTLVASVVGAVPARMTDCVTDFEGTARGTPWPAHDGLCRQ